MNVLFLSLSTAVSDIQNRGIYPDLMRYFANQGHEVFIVCPFERRTQKASSLQKINNIHILGVKTFNITKASIIEKGIATLLIEKQFSNAIQHHFKNVNFDLILYTTPPITFNHLISLLKAKHNAFTYLMLKDIFPQNAVDVQLMKKGILYRYFKNKEEKLYRISDYIGCMSPGNVLYIKTHHSEINQNKIGICPNAIEIKIGGRTSDKHILEKYGIKKKGTLYLYGGNLGIPQGIKRLLEVLSLFKNSHDCSFLIVGSGNQAHLIKNWISEHNPQNVYYVPMLKRDEYDQLEAASDVGMIFLDERFTIPNFPSRMLSYLECKLPLLIATDPNTDIGDIAEKNNFGKKALSSQPDKIAELIDFFNHHPKERKEMGENGFNFLVDNYDVSVAYQSIVSKVILKK